MEDQQIKVNIIIKNVANHLEKHVNGDRSYFNLADFLLGGQTALLGWYCTLIATPRFPLRSLIIRLHPL